MGRKDLEQEQSEKTSIGGLFHCTKRATSVLHTHSKEKQLLSDDPNYRRLTVIYSIQNVYLHKHKHCQIGLK